jgi:hypothetical protein
LHCYRTEKDNNAYPQRKRCVGGSSFCILCIEKCYSSFLLTRLEHSRGIAFIVCTKEVWVNLSIYSVCMLLLQHIKPVGGDCGMAVWNSSETPTGITIPNSLGKAQPHAFFLLRKPRISFLPRHTFFTYHTTNSISANPPPLL